MLEDPTAAFDRHAPEASRKESRLDHGPAPLEDGRHVDSGASSSRGLSGWAGFEGPLAHTVERLDHRVPRSDLRGVRCRPQIAVLAELRVDAVGLAEGPDPGDSVRRS